MVLKLVLLLFSLALFVQPLYGYIDPGTGSYLIQLLIAGLATALYAIKYFWTNIKDFFRSLKKKKKIVTKKSAPMHAKKK